MSVPTSGLKSIAAGSTGNPLSDSGARGMIAMMLNGAILFVSIEVFPISPEGVAGLATFVTGLSFFLGGLYDRFLR